MPISVVCPSCSTKLRAPDNKAGRKTKCPKCSTPIIVPGPASEPLESSRLPPLPQPIERAEPAAERPSIEVICPFCLTISEFGDAAEGTMVRCPVCQEEFEVVEPEAHRIFWDDKVLPRSPMRRPEKSNKGLIAISLGGGLLLVSLAMVVVILASGNRGRPIATMSDFDACQVGQVVNLKGRSSTHEGQVNILVRLVSFDEADSGFKNGVPVVVVCMDGTTSDGETVVSGTVYVKTMRSGLKILLLEHCTFRRP